MIQTRSRFLALILAMIALSSSAMAQPTLPQDELAPPLLPSDFNEESNQAFDVNDTLDQFEDMSQGDVEDVLDDFAPQEDPQETTRKQAFDAALDGLLPLRPDEIRTLLERYDRTQQSVKTPVYPPPKPELVVSNVSLEPGVSPSVVKTAYGHISTISFLDATGAPWPIKDLAWAGNFQISNNSGTLEDEGLQYYNSFRISPGSEFAYGNISIDLIGLQTPVVLTLTTGRELVHYRFDAIVPQNGPLAEPPIIDPGLTITAGSPEITGMLSGIFPQSAERLNIENVDGRTSAYRMGGRVFLRTPLTLLSPAWSNTTSSADGTRIYEIAEAPIVLFSDNGKMVRARLSKRKDVLNDK